jgi:hypothetical protein
VMRSFRERFDPLYPVVVRRVTMKDGSWGDTGESTRKGETILLVRIEKSLDPVATVLVAVHELAHVLQWRYNEDDIERAAHDAEWGFALARIWSALFHGG